MNPQPDPGPAAAEAGATSATGLVRFHAGLDALAAARQRLTHSLLEPAAGGEWGGIRRYDYRGLPGGDLPCRLGMFAGIHGDEWAPARALARFVEKLEEDPEIARGYELALYPACNPTGCADGTRHSRAGLDLNREFWRGSTQPEVLILERELVAQRFEGVISLHSDDTSHGVYGYVAGATLTELLIRPALREAAVVLPLNEGETIDGFSAREGIIRSGYEGVLRPPPGQLPQPFEIILETPQLAPAPLQEEALARALVVILREYRSLQSFAANL